MTENTLKHTESEKINTTSRCVNYAYTLPPKLSSVIKKIGSGSFFCVFASVACILKGKAEEYETQCAMTLIQDKMISTGIVCILS